MCLTLRGFLGLSFKNIRVNNELALVCVFSLLELQNTSTIIYCIVTTSHVNKLTDGFLIIEIDNKAAVAAYYV